MSRLIQQPINQVKLTNVAVVKLQLQGKRFEVACYRNKIMDYRSGHETDLSEVLQSDRIFTNVSKGQFANTQDLRKVFETNDQEAIAKIILQHPKSVIQVSDKERELQMADSLARISTWIANHCVHSVTYRPYTVPQIQHALVSAGFNVQPHKPLKKQYLDAFKFLKQQNVLEIDRAKMELLLSCSASPSEQEQVMLALKKMDPPPIVLMVEQQSSTRFATRLHADPSLYRILDELAQSLPGGKLEIIHQHVTAAENNMEKAQEEEIINKEKTDAPVGSKTAQMSTCGTLASDNANAVQESLSALALDSVADNSLSDSSKSEDSSDDEAAAFTSRSRKQLRQQHKKQTKLAKRHQQKQRQQQTVETLIDSAPTPTLPLALSNSTSSDATSQSSKPMSSVASDPSAKSCNTCGGSFASAAAYRTHFKSDWHRYNQKLKLQGLASVSEEEFNMVDADAFFAENL